MTRSIWLGSLAETFRYKCWPLVDVASSAATVRQFCASRRLFTLTAQTHSSRKVEFKRLSHFIKK
jgi:hypothetical protein